MNKSGKRKMVGRLLVLSVLLSLAVIAPAFMMRPADASGDKQEEPRAKGDPISGFDDRRCDGGVLELWRATDGENHSITVNVENTGDCPFQYTGTDGGVVTIKKGSKKSITDKTARFAVECTNVGGDCRAKFDGTVR